MRQADYCLSDGELSLSNKEAELGGPIAVSLSARKRTRAQVSLLDLRSRRDIKVEDVHRYAESSTGIGHLAIGQQTSLDCIGHPLTSTTAAICPCIGADDSKRYI